MTVISVSESASGNDLMPAAVVDGSAFANRRNGGPASGREYPSDDEILELGVRTRGRGKSVDHAEGRASADSRPRELASESDDLTPGSERTDGAESAEKGAEYRDVFDANPELRRSWEDAHEYRESFATPEEARTATKMLADLRTIDNLFFSQRPEDHAQLAQLVAQLDPTLFGSFAKAMTKLATEKDGTTRAGQGTAQTGSQTGTANGESGASTDARPKSAEAQSEFLRDANTAAVKGVLAAIQGQVDRLLPEQTAAGAKNRMVGEIYREIDQTLQSNDQFSKQIRSALRSGSLDARHQDAIVSLIVNRARQTLPSVAKRVLTEWTSTVLAASRDRAARQRASESRVDIAGARGQGNDGARARTPRDIDYKRMSDSDILNL